MELIILDTDFKELGRIDDFQSLIWKRKYSDTGSYELHTDVQFLPLLQEGAYIYRNDAVEFGLIQGLNYDRSTLGVETLVVKGYFGERILSDRVIEKTITQRGTHEDICKSLVNDYFINCKDAQRKIANFIIGTTVLADDGVTTSNIEMQDTGSTVESKIYEMLNEQSLSYRIRYDYLQNKRIFEIYKGLDRTEGQSSNAWATFSDTFDNIDSVSYAKDTSDYKNFAYVAGEGEGAERIVIEVDCTNGEERKELYVDARDLRKEREDKTIMTDAEYAAILRQRGLEKLATYGKVESIDSNANPFANLIYKEDYDLGDYCSYINKRLNIVTERRLTEVQEVFENGEMKINPFFGTNYLNIYDKIKRGV